MSLYDNNGYRRVTIVDGTSYTGLYASDGSYNGVLTSGDYTGIYHPCGAYNVTETEEDVISTIAPNGSLYIAQTTDGYVIYKSPFTFLPVEG